MYTLGNFSGYSFHGAVWGIGELVAVARVRGYRWVGVADEGGLYGAVELSQACGRAGMGMVVGSRVRLSREVSGWVQLTARDEDGYRAISRLLSEAQAGVVEWEQLVAMQRSAARHIWISYGTQGGMVAAGRASMFQHWMSSWEALSAVDADNLWVELGWHNDVERLLQRRIFSELRRRGWRRWVAMTAARYAGDGELDAQALEVLQSMGTLTRVGQWHADKLAAGDYGLAPARDWAERFVRVPEVLEATAEFVDGCRFDFRYGQLHLPGASGKAADRALRWRCLRGVVRRYRAGYPWPGRLDNQQLLERLGRELEIISTTGYAGYFLVFAELVDACVERQIPLLARGSAAGSLVCYALGVSNVCPFRFGLCFERFLNPERLRHSKLPDIDVDLPWDRRDEMMEWVAQRYGSAHVAMIGGFAHYQGRSAVADVALAMGVPAHQVHAWTRRLPFGSLGKFLADPESYVEASEARNDPRFGEALELAVRIEGLPRHPMMHPCGLVVANRDLRDFCPVVNSAKGFPMTQLSMDPIEDLGLLKLDLLGQAGLGVLRDCVANLVAEAEVEDAVAAFHDIDYTDAGIYAMIRTGEARGVFHIESPAMTSLLQLCRCADIDCLVATVSVIRPGAANEDKKTRFARRYLGLEPPQYCHPVLEEVLADTYGLMVYEEHILLVAHRFAGMDLGTADRLRRILIKKSGAGELQQLQERFVDSALQRGRDPEAIAAVWRELLNFTGFMFNKAHGAAYAVEAYHGCWLKRRWPVHFLAAVLNNRRGFYAPIVYALEILRRGGRFVLPDVTVARNCYHVRRSDAGQLHVQMPLWQIKGVSEEFLQRWQVAVQRMPLRDWDDFVRRCRPRRADAEALARCGALRAFFASRHAALWHAGRLQSRACAAQESAELFSDAVRLDSLPSMDTAAMARAEVELLGFPVSCDPFSLWTAAEDIASVVALSELRQWVGREVEIAGLQVCERMHRTLKGELMKFISLADRSGMAEVVLFPDVYRADGHRISQSPWVRLRVRIEPDATDSGICVVAIAHRDCSASK